MLDIGWSELLLITIVAVVVVGPKDLPRMLRTVGKNVGKVRRMAGDFQRQFNDALREAEIDEIRKSVETVGKDTQRDLESVSRSLNVAPPKDAASAKKAASAQDAAPAKELRLGPPGLAKPDAAAAPDDATPPVVTGAEVPKASAASPKTKRAPKRAPAKRKSAPVADAEKPSDVEAKTPPAPASAGGG